MQFLSAHWLLLVLVNYEVDPRILQGLLPARTKLDAFAGRTVISLVAFLFDKTRVLGLPVPRHTRFEEVNLRIYVAPEKDPSIRGVTFIKEIVPKRTIPLIANRMFHENYAACPMDHHFDRSTFRDSWNVSGVWNHVSATVTHEPAYPVAGSLEEFITEHYWGYARGPRHTLEYRVRHPQWRCCRVECFEIAVDFAENYGKEFECLSNQRPLNVLYAEGSQVGVSFPRRL